MRPGSLHLGLLAGLAVGLGAAGAGAFPAAAQGEEERVPLGPAGLLHGPWLEVDGAISLEPPTPGRHLWLSAASAEGFVRARVRGAGRADLAILFRAQLVRPELARVQGYGFSLQQEKGYIDFLRWDPVGVRDPGVRLAVPALVGRGELEVCLWLAGPRFVAQVYDGVSKELLGSLAWSDPSYRQGALGLYLRLREGEAAPRVEVRTLAPALEGSAPAERPWLASRWLTRLPKADWARVPPEARVRLRRAPDPRAGPDEVALVTDEVGLEVLRGLGLGAQPATPGVPYRLEAGSLAARGAPRVARGRVELPRGLRDPEQVAAAIRAIARAHPRRTRLLELGPSGEGRPILGLRLADDPDDRLRPAVLLTAAHHGRELATPEFVLDAALELLQGDDPRARAWLAGLAVVAVPLVNPDGAEAFWHLGDQFGRKSRRVAASGQRLNSGVDLNRNYPFRWGSLETRFNTSLAESDFYRGPAPASEPEVQAMLRLAEAERFVANLSYHGAATRLLVPYTVPGVPDPAPHTALILGEELVRGLEHRFGSQRYTLVRGLYPVDGVEQDHLFHAFGTLAYLLEVPWNRPEAKKLEEELVHSRPAWQYLLERWLAGPSLTVAVRDAQGAPLEATVEIAELSLRAGERWTTQPGTGLLHRYLPAPGRYTVRAEAQGRRAEGRVEVLKGVARLELSL
ncbi:MAG TPA: M14 family zinc carboxypeptidase [Myxococcota bacterium]|nr:M14 family zinc carboxypeptidase [Myxococcota bacterium]HRY94950.1 M14 family zinc carboxypeptidase [Myxococcota bacterium]HSA19987.1 M14 family zinc carboxypeptidase [Myxococcota bacterium]